MLKKIIKRCTILMLCVVMTVGLFGCNLSVNNGKRIVGEIPSKYREDL